MTWGKQQGRWNARAEEWKNSWKDAKKPEPKTKAKGKEKEKSKEEFVLYSWDGRKVDISLGGASSSGSTSQASALQEESRKLKDMVKRLSQKTPEDGSIEEEAKKMIEENPRETLREKQRELNREKKVLTKKEKIDAAVREREDRYSRWKSGIMEGLKREDHRHAQELQQLREEMSALDDDKDTTKDAEMNNASAEEVDTSELAEELVKVPRQVQNMSYFMESMEQRNNELVQQVVSLVGGIRAPSPTTKSSPQLPRRPNRLSSVEFEDFKKKEGGVCAPPEDPTALKDGALLIAQADLEYAMKALSTEQKESVLAIIQAAPQEYNSIVQVEILVQQCLVQMASLPLDTDLEELQVCQIRGPLQPFWNSGKGGVKRSLPAPSPRRKGKVSLRMHQLLVVLWGEWNEL